MVKNKLRIAQWRVNICLLVFLAIFPACTQAEPAPIRFMLQWSHQAQFAGYYVAQEKGFYKEKGLDVTIIQGGPGLDTSEFLARGEVNYATLWLSTALSLQERAQPLMNLAQVVNGSNLTLVTRKEDQIDSIDELTSKKVSIWEGDFRAPYVAWLQSKKVEPRIFPQYYSVNLFLQRGVEACSAMDYNELHMLYQSGIDMNELNLYFLRDYGFGFPEDGIYAAQDTVRSDPQQASAFREASLEGWRYAAEHPDEALDIVMQYVEKYNIPTNRPHMKWMLEKILDSIIPDSQNQWTLGKLSRQDYERTVSVMREQGMLQSAPAYEDFIGGGIGYVP